MPEASLTRRVFVLSALAVLAPVASCAGAGRQAPSDAPLFTDGEREAVRLYWNAPDRYTVLPSDAAPRINVTIEGSLWYWNFVRLPVDAARADWWKRKFAFERAKAFGTKPIPPRPRRILRH